MVEVSKPKEISITQYRHFFINDNFYKYCQGRLRNKGFQIEMKPFFDDLYSKLLTYIDKWKTEPYELGKYINKWALEIVETKNKEEAFKYLVFDIMVRYATDTVRITPHLMDNTFQRDTEHLIGRIEIIQPGGETLKAILDILEKSIGNEFVKFIDDIYNSVFGKGEIESIIDGIQKEVIRIRDVNKLVEVDEQINSKSINRMAWVIQLGILDFLKEKLNTENEAKLGEIIAEFTGVKSDTARKNINSYMSGPLNKNYPLKEGKIKKINAKLINHDLDPIL